MKRGSYMIDPMPFNFYLLSSIPESFMMITLGLIFLGVHRNWKKILIAAFIQSTVMFFLVKTFDVVMQSGLTYLTLVLFTCLIIEVEYRKSLIGIAISMGIGLLIKGTSALAFVSITNLSFVEIISKNWLRVMLVLPYFLGLFLIILLVEKYHFTLEKEVQNIIDFSRGNKRRV